MTPGLGRGGGISSGGQTGGDGSLGGDGGGSSGGSPGTAGRGADAGPAGGVAGSSQKGGQPGFPSLGGGGRPSGEPPAPRPTLPGGREWSVSVECRSDGVLVYPGGQRFDLAALSGQGAALTEAVRQMVSRRQALVRPGEPGYRFTIRFQVRPDGLRAFYLAYPALGGLGLPMYRQNLDPDEEIR